MQSYKDKKVSSYWKVVFLIGIYITLQLTADVTATKIVQLGRWSLPAGTFIFAITFTWRDLLHRHLGKKVAYATILTAAVANLLMVVYFIFTFYLPSAPFWQGQEAYLTILGVVPRIAIASIIAELISQVVDTEIFAVTKKIPIWMRVLISNAVSLPIDSLVFAVIAFAGILSWSNIWLLMLGQIVFKLIVTVISVPIAWLWRGNKTEDELG